MYKTTCPLGQELLIPESSSEDARPFSVNEIDKAIEFFLDQGFVILRNVIPADLIKNAVAAFERDVKPYGGELLRIGNKFGTNVLNTHNHLVNTLSNVQTAPKMPKNVDVYVKSAIDVLTCESLRSFHAGVAKSDVQLVTWNHFEANPATFPHHDSYFWRQDLKIGEVTGSWIALEDIQPGAGSFYIYPGSHKDGFEAFCESRGRAAGPMDVQDPGYKNLVLEFVKARELKCVAPSLKAGDVVCWDARTIHGALVTDKPQFSRNSFTAHYSKIDGRILAAPENRQKKINGIAVAFPRFTLRKALQSNFPGAYKMAKQMLGRESTSA